jgi:hypothetical protein
LQAEYGAIPAERSGEDGNGMLGNQSRLAASVGHRVRETGAPWFDSGVVETPSHIGFVQAPEHLEAARVQRRQRAMIRPCHAVSLDGDEVQRKIGLSVFPEQVGVQGQ